MLFLFYLVSADYRDFFLPYYACNTKRQHPPMTNTLFIFKNMELFKNLSSLIFPVNTFFYKNLLSLAWKNLGSYTRGFTVQGAFSLQVFKYG